MNIYDQVTDKPISVGFGISTPEQASQVRYVTQTLVLFHFPLDRCRFDFIATKDMGGVDLLTYRESN